MEGQAGDHEGHADQDPEGVDRERADGQHHSTTLVVWLAVLLVGSGSVSVARTVALVVMLPSTDGEPVTTTPTMVPPGTVGSAFDHGPSFSSDGKWIYFTSTRTGEPQIWKVPASGGDAVQLTSNGGFASAEAPDGDLYYTGTSATASPLWRVPSSGGQAVKVLEQIVWWNFEVLQSGIYYTDRSAGVTRLQFFDFKTRRSTTVARNLGQIGGGLSATRDGRAVLFNRLDSAIDDLMLVENFR